MKLLAFNMGYGKGWTSPLKYLKSRDTTAKILSFVKRVNPDVAGLIEINVNTQLGVFEEKFRYSIASCKYSPLVHRIPLVQNFGNAVFSNKKCKMQKRFLSAGIKRLVIECKFSDFRLLLVHLSLEKSSRKKQIQELLRISKKKTVIAGDFNFQDKSEMKPLIGKGLKALVKRPTFPSWNPRKSFDQVFVTPDIRAKAKVLKVRLSDHLPVLVEIK